jgi:hypothetical protein
MTQRNRSQRLSGQHPLSYVGVNPVSPANFIIDNRPPGPTDAQNVLIGDIWLDNSAYPAAPMAENVWMLVSLSNGVATWINFAGGGGGGGAILSVLTDDNNVEVPIGSPAPPPPVPLANGQLEIIGGSTGTNIYINMNTRRGPDVHTVSIDLNNSIGQPNTTADGSEGVYALGGNNNFITDRFMHNYGTNNTFLGNSAGNMTLTIANASNNTCLGAAAGSALVGAGGGQGSVNTFIGSSAGFSATNASGNFFGGALSGTFATTATFNTAAGLLSLSNLLTGTRNICLGYNTGSNYAAAEFDNICIGTAPGRVGENGTIRITTPVMFGDTSNIFIGNGAGNNTYTLGQGIFNVGVGTSVFAALSTGTQNSAFNNGCLDALTTGSSNACYAYDSCGALTTGSNNSAFGVAALQVLLTGSNNTVFGSAAGSAYNGAESSNIVIGSGQVGQAGEANIIRIGTIGQAVGADNIFIGRDSGNTTYTTAGSNVFIGDRSGAAITTALRNCAVGPGFAAFPLEGPLASLTTGQSNTTVGCISLRLLTTGSNNCVLGDSALGALLTGNNNIVIGTQSAQNYVAAESGNIIIGPTNSAVIGDNNTLRLASGIGGGLTRAFIQGIRGITTGNNDAIAVLVDSANQLGTVSSTRTVKDNINDMGSYSNVLYGLRPVTFNYKQHSPDVISVGLIAEEVEQVMPRLVAYQEDKPLSVKYHDLSPMLLNELQKLEKRVTELERKCKCQKQA